MLVACDININHARMLPLLSSKYKHLDELNESVADLELEIQIIKAGTDEKSTDFDEHIGLKLEHISQMDKMKNLMEKEVQMMERYILNDNTIRTCEDVFKVLSMDGSTNNITSGFYPVVVQGINKVKREYCALKTADPKLSVASSNVGLSLNTL